MVERALKRAFGGHLAAVDTKAKWRKIRNMTDQILNRFNFSSMIYIYMYTFSEL